MPAIGWPTLRDAIGEAYEARTFLSELLSRTNEKPRRVDNPAIGVELSWSAAPFADADRSTLA